MRKIIFILTIYIHCVSVAAVPGPQTHLDINSIAPVSPDPYLTTETVALVIPTDIPQNATATELTKAISKKTLRSLAKSNFVKKSTLGKTANSIKSATSTEISSLNANGHKDQQIEHKVKFSLDPYKAEARLKYSGFFNCSAVYDAFDQDLKLEITEKLADTSVKIQHSSTQQNSSLLLGWDW